MSWAWILLIASAALNVAQTVAGVVLMIEVMRMRAGRR